MPKEVTFDNMKFGNLIDSVPNMLKKSKDIKEILNDLKTQFFNFFLKFIKFKKLLIWNLQYS